LRAERLAEDVGLEEGEAERVVVARAAGADGEVLLAQRGEDVGERLQGTDDLRLEREGGAQPDADEDHGERPADLARVVAAPQQDQRQDDGGEAADEGDGEDPPLVADRRPALRGHGG
jgi:hypothetical protein